MLPPGDDETFHELQPYRGFRIYAVAGRWKARAYATKKVNGVSDEAFFASAGTVAEAETLLKRVIDEELDSSSPDR